MDNLSARINSFIEKQLSLKTYFCKICGQRHKLNSHLGQSHYIENFGRKVEKQSSPIRFKNRAEAESYGIKLPPEPDKPKIPKTPAVKKPSQPRVPKSAAGDKVGKVIGEVGRQLTPKGPYRAPEDISQDIQEARRIARGIRGMLQGKKE